MSQSAFILTLQIILFVTKILFFNLRKNKYNAQLLHEYIVRLFWIAANCRWMKFLIIDVIDNRKKPDLHVQKMTNEMEKKNPFYSYRVNVNIFQSFKKCQRFHCSQRGSISYFKHSDKSFDFYLQHPIHSATFEF